MSFEIDDIKEINHVSEVLKKASQLEEVLYDTNQISLQDAMIYNALVNHPNVSEKGVMASDIERHIPLNSSTLRTKLNQMRKDGFLTKHRYIENERYVYFKIDDEYMDYILEVVDSVNTLIPDVFSNESEQTEDVTPDESDGE